MTEVISSMPVLPLVVGMRVRFEAVDPTTGSPVAGVTVSNAVLYAVDVDGEAAGGTVDSGPYMLVPGPTPVAAAKSPPIKIKGGL